MKNDKNDKNDVRWLRVEVASLCVLGLVGGCATIAGLDTGYTEEPSCDPTRPPDPPSAAGSAEALEFVAAFRRIDLDEEDETPHFGYDLDGKCSCTVDEQSCAKPPWIDIKKVVCDDPHGVDNGTGVALARINAISGGAVTSVLINQGLDDGHWTILVRVRGYSGKPDDEKVSVAVYETPGTATPPVWDGTMAWPVTDTSLVAGSGSVDSPLFVDENAYVRGGVLVAHIKEMRLLFRATTVRLPVIIYDTTLAGTLVDGGNGKYSIKEGTLAGVWRHADVFQALSGLRYGSKGDSKLCKDSLTYLQVRNLFCSVTDIYDPSSASAGGGGNGGASGASPECNAVSFGMRFEAAPAALGSVVPPQPPPIDICDPGLDPSDDKCR